MIFKDYDTIVFAGDFVTDMGSAQTVGEGLNDNDCNIFIHPRAFYLCGSAPYSKASKLRRLLACTQIRLERR